MNVYTPPKSSPPPPDFDEFYESLSPQEKQLHELAIQKLQSSYFIQWTHMYKKWKKAKNAVMPLIPPVTATVAPAPPSNNCGPCANLQSATYYS
jgi:hypothetical protein